MRFQLRSCVWEITLRCCFSCKYCGSGAGKARQNELTTEECLCVADQLADIGCTHVSLIGGEVFMRPDWLVIAKTLTSRKVSVSIITNGFLFTDQLIGDIKASGVSTVAVSLDGSEWIHDQYRQAGSFRRAIKAIDVLTANRIPVSVISTLHSKNYMHLEEMYRILRHKRIFAWQLQACSPMGNAAKGTMDTAIDFGKVISFVDKHRNSTPFVIGIADNIGYYTETEDFLRGKLAGGGAFRGCRAGLTSIGIDSAGNVRGCESMYAPVFIEGNLRDRTLYEIWNDPDAFAYNRQFKPEMLTGKCKSCAMGSRCAGGGADLIIILSMENYMNSDTVQGLRPNRKYWVIFLIVLSFNLWLAYQVPYTHDDWDWGLDIGLNQLMTASMNSRYAGNTIEILLTRSMAAKTIVMGLVFTLIPVAAAVFAFRCIGREQDDDRDFIRRLTVFLLGFFLLLCMPSAIWQQTYGWVAGFSNFVVSGLALLFYGYTVITAVRHSRTYAGVPQSWKRRKIRRAAAAALITGFVIELFLENLAVFFLICSLIFFAYTARRNRNILYTACALLLGNAAGFCLMFSSSVYKTLWETGYAIGTYRMLMYDRSKPISVFIREAGDRYIHEFVPGILDHHPFVTAAAAFLLFLTGLHFAERKAMGLVFYGINLIFCLYYLYLGFTGTASGLPADLALICLVTLEIAVIFRHSRWKMTWLYLVWITPFLVMAPMVMINTAGPRSYYTTSLCLIVFCQILLAAYLENTDGRKVLLTMILFALPAAVNIFHIIHIYEDIGAVTQKRYELIEQARCGQRDRLVLPAYDHKEYLWNPDPTNPDRVEFFRAFYHIPENIILIFESNEDDIE